MFEKMNIDNIIKDMPWTLIGITAGLFIAAFIINKLIKRFLKKAMARMVADESSFWSQFWKSEHTLVLSSVGWVIWLAFIGGAIYLWSGRIGKLFTRVQTLYPPLLRAVVIILVTIIVLKATQILIHVIIDKITPIAETAAVRGTQRVQTLRHAFIYGSTIVIITIGTLMILSNFGIDMKAILATVGIASVAIGFGAQSLVKDIVSGIFIIIEDQFAVGDVAMINSEGGVVERMTLRVTQLRNTAGMLITIPNGSIDMVKNLTSEWSRVDYKIGVAYETDLDRALDVLIDEIVKLKADMPEEIIEEPERLGVDEFGDSSITLRVWIKTKPLMQWKVNRELNRRVHKRFEKEGIEIPFPQRTLWIREPKEEALLAALSENKSVK
jgi:small-conductance mechanosensitive channel